MLDGLLLIDKAGDCTSHDVVQRVRRLVRQKKVGHCGTLDPTATGLLLLTLGKATRLTRFLIRAPKVYTGTIRFGRVTDTFDAAGEVVDERSTEGLTRERIETAMRRFEGEYEHLTPAYSAKKSGGRKRYQMARRGEDVPEERKLVRIYDFRATGDVSDRAEMPFRLACESGTYARSLAHELGEAVESGAHLSSLRRIGVGPFKVEDAIGLGELERLAAGVANDDRRIELNGVPGWIPFDDIQLPFAEARLDAGQERRIGHGQTVLLQDLDAAPGDWVRLANRRGQFVCVGSVTEIIGGRNLAVVRPRIVFA